MKAQLKYLLATAMLSLPFTGMSQEADAVIVEKSWFTTMLQTEQGQLLLAIGGFMIVLIILLLIMVVLLARTANLVTGTEKKASISWTQKLKQKWITGKLKPVGQEKDMLLDHNYDGIQEMDYGMPPWLRYVFIGSFIFAVFYVPAYMVFDVIPDQDTELADQYQRAALLAEARAKAGIMSITAETAQYNSEAEAITAGNVIYQKNCAVCHAADGGGGVGPNLTDDYWIHGNDMKGLFTTVSEGVPTKGMIPWKGKLNPKDIENVSNYIISLVGTTSAAPKEPQGELRKRIMADERIKEAVENPDADNPGPIDVLLDDEVTQ